MARCSYQKGSVRKVEGRSGPIFVGRYRERNLDGGWRQKSVTLRGCQTMKAAQKKLDDILEDINESNGVVAEDDVAFTVVLDQLWPAYLATSGVKPSTRFAYRVMVGKWIRPHFGDVLLTDITPRDIGRFMAKLNDAGLSAQYRLNLYRLLCQLLNLAVEYDLLESTPARHKVHRPSVRRAEKPVFSAAEAAAIIAAVPDAFRPAIATLAVTGLRAGELVALRWKDVDFLNRKIHVRAAVWRGKLQTTKTRASTGVLPVPEQLVEILREHRKTARFRGSEAFVFAEDDGSPLKPDKLRKRAIYPALEKLGIPRQSRASGCHAFRHLAGSLAHRETGSVKLAQQLLRHSSIATTSNVYVHTDQTELEGVADALGRVLLGELVAETVAERPVSGAPVH